MDDPDEASNYQVLNTFKLSDIPPMIHIENNLFHVRGAILCVPPLIDDDIEHYTCCVKINESWELYDNLQKKPSIQKDKKVVLHCIFYTKVET